MFGVGARVPITRHAVDLVAPVEKPPATTVRSVPADLAEYFAARRPARGQ